MAEIQLENLTKVYPDGTKAVSSLDLEIPARASSSSSSARPGCGKTSALRMIAGLEQITGGTVRIGGEVVNALPPKDRDVAMVFQNYALYPHMSAYDNMGFALKMRGVSKDGDRRPRPRRGARARPLRGAAEEAADALGRPAPAGGDGPRDRARAAGVPDGRAALQPRREAPRRDARRDLADPARPRRDDDLRHPRPGRGDDDGRPRLRDARRVPPAGRLAAGAVRPAGQPVRRRVHRLAGDEPRQGRRWRTAGCSSPTTLRSVPDAVAAARPGLNAYEGKPVVLGIRPEDLEDAALAREPGAALDIEVDIREDMGSEVYVHFAVPGEPVETAEVLEAMQEEDVAGAVHERMRRGVPFIARLDRGTKAREGERLRLAVNTARLHFFDPDTGLGIYD